MQLPEQGTLVPVTVKISEGGEVLLQGPGLFAGYYKDPQATAKAFQEGWLATGDADGRWSVTLQIAIDTSRAESRSENSTAMAAV